MDEDDDLLSLEEVLLLLPLRLLLLHYVFCNRNQELVEGHVLQLAQHLLPARPNNVGVGKSDQGQAGPGDHGTQPPTHLWPSMAKEVASLLAGSSSMNCASGWMRRISRSTSRTSRSSVRTTSSA